jgi:uncharacterized protein
MEQRAAFVLTPGQRIAVVGLSAKPDRPSFDVARTMQRSGFQIIPVNPHYAGEAILGVRCVASLSEIGKPIDVVNCFRKSEDMLGVAEDVIAMRPLPRVLWMQIGIQSGAARALAEAVEIMVIENQCIKIAYQNQPRSTVAPERLFSSPN